MENDPYLQETVVETVETVSCFYTNNLIVLSVVGIALLLLSALVSGSKVAFQSLTPQQLRNIRKNKTLTTKAALLFVDRREELLALVSVLNSFNYVVITLIWLYLSEPLFGSMQPLIQVFVQLLILVPILLVFSEVTPKIVAKQNPEKVVGLVSIPMFVMSVILKPLTFFVALTYRRVEKQVINNQSISVGDLSDVIETPSAGLMNEREMLKGIIEFGNIEVSEIMCPRVDMFAIDSKESFDKVLKKITSSGYSRIPVYTDNFDQISGILYIKDLLPYVNNSADFNWLSLLRQPHFVPENKKINDLLEELQMQKNHMAIVVDEYGGTSGLVTMEDIIEMIVGDISDEFDQDEANYTKLDAQTYIFKGKTLLSDFCDVLHIEDEVFAEIQGESESVAGLILEMKGELPRKNERFEYDNFEFTVEEVDKRRITSVRVHLKSIEVEKVES